MVSLRNAGAVVLDDDARWLFFVAFSSPGGRNGDIDDRRDPGFLTGVDAVIDQFFDDDPQPIERRMPGLRDQLLLTGELHQARGGEGHALDLVRRLVRLLPRPAGHDAARLQAEARPGDVDGAVLTAQGRRDGGHLVAAIPHVPQELLALQCPTDARLNIGKLCKNFRFGLWFQQAKSVARPCRISPASAGSVAGLAFASTLTLRTAARKFLRPG